MADASSQPGAVRPGRNNVRLSLWIVQRLAIALVPCYVLCTRVPVRNSRAIVQRIDYSRIRLWNSEEGRD